MTYRIFLSLLVLANIYMVYQIYSLGATKRTLASAPAGYVIGPENADLMVVEFLDYSCQHCKDIDPIIMEAIKRDGKARYIPRPVPSASEAGAKYAEFAYAAGLQGKFIEAHGDLIGSYRALDEPLKKEIAAKHGLDLAKLEADFKSPETQKKIQENARLHAAFYQSYLPVFIIGGKIIFSPREAPTVDDFMKMFQQARNG